MNRGAFALWLTGEGLATDVPSYFPDHDWLSKLFEGEKVRNFPHLAEFSRGKECGGARALAKTWLTRASILPRMALDTLERRNVAEVDRVLKRSVRFMAGIALSAGQRP